MNDDKGVQLAIQELSIWFSSLVLTLIQIVILPMNLLTGLLTPDGSY